MKRWLPTCVLTLLLALGLMAALASPAHAASPGTPGQPGQSCQQQPNSPPGFNTTAFMQIATKRYAGSAPQNSNNPKSVSQYDVACFQLSQP